MSSKARAVMFQGSQSPSPRAISPSVGLTECSAPRGEFLKRHWRWSCLPLGIYRNCLSKSPCNHRENVTPRCPPAFDMPDERRGLSEDLSSSRDTSKADGRQQLCFRPQLCTCLELFSPALCLPAPRLGSQRCSTTCRNPVFLST